MRKINVFASGGYGLQIYNLLSNDFDFMYIVGAQLHIPITSWGSAKNGKDYLEIQKNLIFSQADAYRQNLRVKMIQKLYEMEILKNLIYNEVGKFDLAKILAVEFRDIFTNHSHDKFGKIKVCSN